MKEKHNKKRFRLCGSRARENSGCCNDLQQACTDKTNNRDMKEIDNLIEFSKVFFPGIKINETIIKRLEEISTGGPRIIMVTRRRYNKNILSDLMIDYGKK